jgi:hypothetical protein
MCQWVLTRPKERSTGVVGFISDRKIAAPDTPLRGSGGAEPGQLKSLGTDAFVAFDLQEKL